MRTLDLAADANARLAEDPSLVRDWLEGPVNDYLARITSFKLGWGGERRDLAGTWELPRMPVLYRLMRRVSR